MQQAPRKALAIVAGTVTSLLLAAVACRDFSGATAKDHEGGGGDATASKSGGGGAASEAETASGAGAKSLDNFGGNVTADGGSTSDGATASAGEAGEAGAGGGAIAYVEDPWPEPSCVTKTGHPPITMTAASDASLARTAMGTPFVAFVTQPASQILALTWSIESVTNPDVVFEKWGCFDALPKPARTAAGNGSGGRLQVYASSLHGQLYVRQATSSFYEDWTRLAGPRPRAIVRDVAVSDANWLVLYVATDDGIFMRLRDGDESRVADPEWLQVVSSPAIRLTVSELEDGRQAVHFIDGRGQLMAAAQVTAGEDFQFGLPEDIDDGLRFVDLATAEDAEGRVQLFAVRDTGELFTRTQTSATAWGHWLLLPVSDGAALKTIAAGSLLGRAPTLLSVASNGLPRISLDGGETWRASF